MTERSSFISALRTASMPSTSMISIRWLDVVRVESTFWNASTCGGKAQKKREREGASSCVRCVDFVRV
eukprot:181812-Chlamydomonas_euryale.AAC.2